MRAIYGLATVAHQTLIGTHRQIAELCCDHAAQYCSFADSKAWDIGSDYGLSLAELWMRGIKEARGIEIFQPNIALGEFWWETDSRSRAVALREDEVCNILYSEDELGEVYVRQGMSSSRLREVRKSGVKWLDILCADLFDIVHYAAGKKEYERDLALGSMVLPFLLGNHPYRILLNRMAPLVKVGGVLSFGLSSASISLTDTAKENEQWSRNYRNLPLYLRAEKQAVVGAYGIAPHLAPPIEPVVKQTNVVVVTEEDVRQGSLCFEFLGMEERPMTHDTTIDVASRMLLQYGLSGMRLHSWEDYACIVRSAVDRACEQSSPGEQKAVGTDYIYSFAYRRVQ